MRITLAQLNPTVGLIKSNVDCIIAAIEAAKKLASELIVFPELAVCGYPPEDLIFNSGFVADVEEQLSRILIASSGICVIVGTLRSASQGYRKVLYNSAAIIENGVLKGFHDKNLLPTYDVFDELRYFEPGKECRIWLLNGKKIGVTICEDIWQHGRLLHNIVYENDPIQSLCLKNPELVVNLSASPYSFNKPKLRLQTVQRAALSLKCPICLCNQVGANDSLIFDGYSFVIDSRGEMLFQASGFQEEISTIDLTCETSYNMPQASVLEDLFCSLALGVKDYFKKTGCRQACLGLSGGVDSALVACIAKEALGEENLLGIAMPSRFSSQGSLDDAHALAGKLNIRIQELPIEAPFDAYLRLLKNGFEKPLKGLVEENLQARIRGTLLMAFSNQTGYLLLNTGNKSEMAMGYCTLYGDMCGALAVIGDLFKTRVYELAQWVNRNEEIIPWNSIRKPPSAELRPNQKDSDSLPDYAILDPILEDLIEKGHTSEQIAVDHRQPLPFVQQIVEALFKNEYKRRQAALILRVSEKGLTPSSGRKIPIIHRWRMYTKNDSKIDISAAPKPRG